MSDQMEALRARLEGLSGTPEDQLEDVLYDLTESIVVRMAELGLSRSELAARLGVSRAMVSKMLRGNTNFTVRTLVELSRTLDCRVSIQFPPCGSKAVRFFAPAEPAVSRSYDRRLETIAPQPIPEREADAA